MKRTAAKFQTLILYISFLAISSLFLPATTFADEFWSDAAHNTNALAKQNELPNNYIPLTSKARTLNLNSKDLSLLLKNTPINQVTLPMPDGKNLLVNFVTTHVMAPELAKRFPEIKTYKAVDTKNKNNYGNLDITAQGFHAMFNYNGRTVFIDPLKNGQYQSYYSSDYIKEFAANFASQKFTCESSGHNHPENLMTNDIKKIVSLHESTNENTQKDVSFGSNIRTYRLAVAATGEFTGFHGGTKVGALSAIVTGINRINQVFERDFAVSMQLVANNDDVIFLDGDTDPYTDGNSSTMIDENPPVLNDAIGFDNYDIGHVFGLRANGGIAFFYAPCSTRSNGKARAASSFVQPIGDRFFIGLAAHEFGHQLGAPHSFNGGTNSCGSGYSSSGAYEPGSGTTIMSYAGICGEENIQNSEDDYFHTSSIEFVRNFIDNRGGDTCGTISQSNNMPSVDAGIDAVIPKETPFILTGSADDLDGDNLSYTWEQMDLGAQTTSRADFTDDGSRPLFRSFEPNSSATRIFPQIDDVLNATTTYGEILPTTDRTLTMRLTVRDGNGGVESDTRLLSVDSNSGPFVITAPTTATWEGESTQTVSWDVANTNIAPVNCSNVSISLSTNGGQSFTQTLVSNTPNDGTENIQVPNLNTSSGRVRVMCATQPFFAVNSASVTVIANTGVNIDPTANDDTYTVDQNSSNNSLSVLVNDSDADGDSLSITSTSNISNGGSATVSGTSISYTPLSDFSGNETFNYTIDDGNGGTATAQVSVTVTQENRPPQATDDAFTVVRNSGTVTIRVLDNDSDPDNDALTITSTSTASNGGTVSTNLANTRIRYRPAADYFGLETFTYAISDGNGGTATATVSVTVENDNQAPVANDDSFTVEQDSGESIFNLVLNDDDPNNDTLTITSISPSTNGSTIGIVLDATHMSYQPSSGFSGVETLTYTISDGNGGNDTAQVIITVNPTNPPSNQAPVANNDTYTVDENSASTTLNVLSNDSDANNDTLMVTSLANINNGGSVTISGNGQSLSYQPASDFFGTETFTYTISDGNGGTDTAQVIITVTEVAPPNQTPIANDDSFTVQQDSAATSFNVLSNDTDADNDNLSISSVSGVSNGFSVSVSGNTISYQPASGFSGTDTFSYSISDSNGGIDTAQVTITVTAVITNPPSPPTSGGGSGGGSFGLFLLSLLSLRLGQRKLYEK